MSCPEIPKESKLGCKTMDGGSVSLIPSVFPGVISGETEGTPSCPYFLRFQSWFQLSFCQLDLSLPWLLEEEFHEPLFS